MAKYSIAIIGAGPSGYFAAQALQNLETEELNFSIDLIERLPTPWGLVRSGVAPDHPKIKSVSKVFEKVATAGNVSLFGNVEVGRDISLEALKTKYDAVILATGTSEGKQLGIPGEDLPNSLSAADFVPWYNGHPDYAKLTPDLSSDTAVVIGAGNVAMDVARLLALDPSELDPTDTAGHAIESFKKSKIRKVYICARRGPEFASFTSPELRELPDLEHTNVLINKEVIEAAIKRVGPEPEKHLKSNLDAMLKIASNELHPHERTMEFLFQHVPSSIDGQNKVESVTFSTPEGQKTINCGIVISAIGYQPKEQNGLKVESNKLTNTDGHIEDNIYVVGWAKRGPSGVIGTNKSDAADVAKLLVSKLSKEPKAKFDLGSALDAKIVTQPIWEKINSAEVAAGEALGKPRLKAISREDLLGLGEG
ncbi:MAG: glutamate synthase subunit beta [Candidatus Nanopelagicaceae bacterium]|nr:glutamate synthase subunit beta [Candidatus Nanopelagicaceae bacterium]